MKRFISIITVSIIVSILLISCGIDTGVNSLSSATKELMQISGKISEYELILDDESKDIPNIKKTITEGTRRLKVRLETIEDYKIDDNFKEKFENVEERLINLENKLE